jgi:hypothetical protein
VPTYGGASVCTICTCVRPCLPSPCSKYGELADLAGASKDHEFLKANAQGMLFLLAMWSPPRSPRSSPGPSALDSNNPAPI